MKHSKKCFWVFLILVAFLIVSTSSNFTIRSVKAADSDNDGIDDQTERELILKYAPNLYFKAGENFFPVDCGYHINNSKLYRWEGENKVLVDDNPNLTSLSGYDETYFLANSLENYTNILNDYKSKLLELGYKYYGRVYKDSDHICVQYWFFYAYNDYELNQHEGDWEMIVVFLDLPKNPIGVAYSQHHSGQYAFWGDVEKTDGTHPNVYVARGSHASYFRPYQGKVGLENDEVGNDGLFLPYNHEKLVIEVMGELGSGNHPANQSWLDFEGRWGAWKNIADAALGYAGPPGPAYGENEPKWTGPYSWASGQFVVTNNWFILSWITYNLLWIFVAVFVALFAKKMITFIKKKRNNELPRVLDLFKGKAAIGVIMGLVALVLSFLAIFYTWYFVYIDIEADIITAQGNVLVIDGLNGIQVNFLVAGEGMTPYFNFAIPFYMLLVMSVCLSIFDLFIVDSKKKLGTKYIIGGIVFLVMLTAIIIFISRISSMVSMLGTIIGQDLPPETKDIVDHIAASPFQGSYSTTITGLGNVGLRWGFETGGYLLLASAIIKIVAGVMLKIIKEETE